MADGTPVTYEDLTEELKKKYDEVSNPADSIGSFHRTRSHGIVERVLTEGAPMEWTCPPRPKNAPGAERKAILQWHNSFSHATNDRRVWRQQIQMAIEQGRLIFNQYAMKVDTHPFPAVNMVECTYPGGCQPSFSFNINMRPTHKVFERDPTVGRKTIPTTFFIVDSKSTYAVLLGRDWIHANCCIPSTMHQCVIQWDGDEVEVVHADDSAEISTAGMNAWETAGQEPLSGINLDDCERIDVTKNGVRLVLSTGLTV
ncbi:hypothetical protein QYE76_036235 [Lolium multiflorum]|uniref:Uncharacterized protein n=1 Tax=Lolium multiflorum TaxID=4521 RepID=A0AAD8R1L9_LOLMU|nr:hypothetical protein QYE76_036235 [Lolium multiflorum]